MPNFNGNLLKNSENCRGFTLLELSVVIVIIGLLVSGLVGAKAYLRSAEMKSLVNESKLYIDAFGQFQQVYTAVPGDMNDAANNWPGAHQGDGNGLVRAGATANTPELFYVFEHLGKAGLIGGNYTGLSKDGTTTTSYADPGVNVPNALINNVVYLFDHPDTLDGAISSNSYYFNGLYSHVLRVAAISATANGLPTTAFLTPKQAYQIDAKFDDGVPNSGWIETPNNTNLPNCTNGTDYTVSRLGMECYLILKLQ